MKIGFIGTGTIASAVVTGLDLADYPYEEIVVSARSADISARLARTCKRVRVEPDNQAIADQADILFLTVRPQVAEEVLSHLSYRSGQLIVCVVATLTHEKLMRWTGPDVTIVRAMPLPFVATGEGPTPIFPANDTVEKLFAALGTPVVTKSHEEFETIAVASMTMGLHFGIAETIADWLADKGIAPQSARSILDAINLNLAKTGQAEAEKSLAQLREEHSTKGGLNEQVYRVFVEHEGKRALQSALDSAYARVMPDKA